METAATTRKRIPTIIVLILLLAVAVAGAVYALSGNTMIATFWSLVPPLIAIIMALVTKEVYSSLLIGIILGNFFFGFADGKFSFETFFNGIFFSDGGIITNLADSWNVGIMVFLVVLGIIVALMNKAGGSRAYGEWAARHIKTRAGACLSTFLLGVLIFGLLYYVLDAFFRFGLGDLVVGTFAIALINTIFRAATSFTLLPFDRQIEKLVVALVKESEDEKSLAGELDRLDERFLEHPVLAVEQSRMTVNAMARTARENLLRAVGLIGSFSESVARKVEQTEDLIDLYEDKLGTYLVRLNTHELNKEQNESVSKYLHTLSDFERISDHAMNIMEAAREIHEKKIAFSGDAERELQVLTAALTEILQLSVDSFVNEDLTLAYRVEPLEEHIDILCDEMKLNHVERLQQGLCSLNVGFVFNDLITNFERVADHCSNIAIAMIELQSDAFDMHEYVINLKELRSHDFNELYEEYSKKYEI